MAVYVDPLQDRGWRLGPNCHMLADTLEELNEMADAIGMKREWLQHEPVVHYDLTVARRRRAVELGAREVNRRQIVAIMRLLRGASC